MLSVTINLSESRIATFPLSIWTLSMRTLAFPCRCSYSAAAENEAARQGHRPTSRRKQRLSVNPPFDLVSTFLCSAPHVLLSRRSRSRKKRIRASRWLPSVDTSIRSTPAERVSWAKASRRSASRRGVGLAHLPAVGVQQQPLAGLGVLQFQQADGRQLLLARDR